MPVTSSSVSDSTLNRRKRSERFRRYWKKVIKVVRNIAVAAYYRCTMMPRYALPEIDLPSLNIPETCTTEMILDDICMPPYFMFDDHDDFKPLMSIVAWLQPKVVLELGTAHGNTTANICKQCSYAAIYTVNAPVEDQTGDIVTFELTSEEVGRVYRKYNFQHQVTQIYKNTL